MSRRDDEKAEFIAGLWKGVYGILALALVGAVWYVISVCHEASKPQFVKPGLDDYRVLQVHEDGNKIEVAHHGKTYVLAYAATNGESDPDARGPYPYEPGETLRLQVMCEGRLPLFYKQLDDGVGERKYELAEIFHNNASDFCPED